MINIGIDPVAISLGPLEVRWYGIMVVLAVVAVIVISLLEARRVGLAEEHIYSVGLWAIIGGIIVSRLLHVIDKWGYYMANPAQIIGFEGLTVYGAVFGALLAILIYCWVKKISFWRIGDVAAPGAILGQAIGRIGCTINGCCFGLENPPWWAGSIIYTHPHHALFGTPLWVPLYPTQIYHLIWNLIGFGILWSLRRRLKPQGSLFLLYLAVYAAGDLSIRFVRAGEPFRSGMFFNMQQAQLIGIVILVVTVPWLIIRMWRARAQAPTTGGSGEVSRPERNRGA
jgi:phosphatidylglycerol:prolipoprotein diacylglycerol transferase